MPPAYSVRKPQDYLFLLLAFQQANQKVRFRLDNGDEVQGEIIKRYSTDIMVSIFLIKSRV